jgi:hypothetical protein
MNDAYPDKDFPWKFYFNGELMPKWGACWGMARVAGFLHADKDWDQDIGHRDVYIIGCQIDHVGVVESADPGVFVYAVQEVLCLLLSEREAVLATLREQPAEVYPALVEAALRMRELALERGCAFWTSGYEDDQRRLVEAMRRCHVPPGSPDFAPAPHIQRLRGELSERCAEQIRRVHRLAGHGVVDKEMRGRLCELRADQSIPSASPTPPAGR